MRDWYGARPMLTLVSEPSKKASSPSMVNRNGMVFTYRRVQTLRYV